ncbi:hypothetical protein EYR41_003553 [Orbilia oligospora]|uniref:Uncharacterized protein n=1 Tax=Orbilia oligospora TaxID=2813651 RepID=A0A8H2HRL4_ORBOL|nr:hypothetical protein EYR41_003553 [Orbilia oligospora]
MFLTHQNPNIPCWPSNSILKNTYACRVSRSARDREKSQSSYVKVRGVKILMLTNMSSTHLKLCPREEYAGKILVRVKG